MSHALLLLRMDAQWRLARHYGIANALVFRDSPTSTQRGRQRLGDARPGITSLLANAETRIIYRQESDQLGITGEITGLTGTEQKLLPTLGTGQGLWRVEDHSYVTQHQLHPAELELF